ncbi:MAG: hypothetical protein V4438_04310 [Patescibacteria group bacterium]
MKPKFKRKLVFFLSINPYSQDLCVVLNGQFSDAIAEIRKLKTENAKSIVNFYEENKEIYKNDHEVGKGCAKLFTELPVGYVMLIEHCDSWIESVGLVVHESLHLVHYILRRAGIDLCKDSEEAFTYLQEKIVEDILAKMY